MDSQAEAGYAARWTTEGSSGEKTVTEAEWMACTEPERMLEFLRGRVSKRKLRLFAVACCRRIWHLFPENRSQATVEVAEQYADKAAGEQERKDAFKCANAVQKNVKYSGDYFIPLMSSTAAAVTITRRHRLAEEASSFAAAAASGGAKAAKRVERRAQALILRDLFGNPYHPVTLDPAVLTWNDAAVVRLAQAAYDERHLPEGTLDNGRLAVLADALEEAGCTDADILGHLRGPGPHVRGCWPVDLCLGKS